MNAFRNAFNKARSSAAGAAGAASTGASSGAASTALKALSFLISSAFVVGGVSAAAYYSVITIQPGHQAIVYNRIGGLDEHKVLTEGLNFVIPWFQRAIVYNVRTRPQLINSQSGSKDLQMVQISLRVLFKPDSSSLPFIYRRLGLDYDERVLPSIVNEVTKAVVAQYNASELLTKRDVVSRQIGEMLTARASDFKILLDDVSITHLAFSKEYTAAVEAKQVAQQEAERAKYIVDRAIQEKQSIIIRAMGEAKSAELIGKVNELLFLLITILIFIYLFQFISIYHCRLFKITLLSFN